jgi:hypothetical protein
MRLTDVTPAVVRLENGWRVSAQLEVISISGGLLALSKPLSPGCPVKVMFVTETGPVLADAEMLNRLSGGRQPFKFTTLYEDGRSRLEAMTQSEKNQDPSDRGKLEKYRVW